MGPTVEELHCHVDTSLARPFLLHLANHTDAFLLQLRNTLYVRQLQPAQLLMPTPYTRPEGRPLQPTCSTPVRQATPWLVFMLEGSSAKARQSRQLLARRPSHSLLPSLSSVATIVEPGKVNVVTKFGLGGGRQPKQASCRIFE